MLDKDNGDPFMVKLNTCFEPEWYKIFEVPDYNFIEDILEINDSVYLLQTSYLKRDYTTFMSYNIKNNHINYHYTLDMADGGFIIKDSFLYISGYTDINGYVKETIYKTDLKGNAYWAKHFFPDDESSFTRNADICDFKENKLFALVREGNPNSVNTSIGNGVRIFKLDTSSNIRLNKIISDTTREEVPVRMLQLRENRYVISSNYYPDNNKEYSFPKIYLVDSNMNILKSYIINTESMGYDISFNLESYPTILTRTSDNHIFLGGALYNATTGSDAYLIKLDSNLNIAQIGTDTFTYDFNCNKPVKDSTVKLPAPEIIPLNPDSFDLTPITHSAMIVLSVKKDISKSSLLCSVYPNPAKDGLNIILPYTAEYSIKIQDINGKILKEENTEPSIKQYKLDILDLPQGIYILEIYEKNTQKRAVYKVMKE